jgi:hypothetical protein
MIIFSNNHFYKGVTMKLYLAGGEGITRIRHKKMFENGVRHRLVSFWTGFGPVMKVVNCAKEWESEHKEETSHGE